MEISSRRILAVFAALSCATCFALVDCQGQTLSANSSGNRDIRERITTIFRETLRQGEIEVEHNERLVTARTFVPPTKQHLDEIRGYGNDAIPIVAEYLTSGSGFEKYLAMRFLSSIGGIGVIEPLRNVVLKDPSSSLRLVALLWLTEAPWDLASPIIQRAAETDNSPQVRDKAKEILAQHKANK